VIIGEYYLPEPKIITVARVCKKKLLDNSNHLVTATIMNHMRLNINKSNSLHSMDCKSDQINLNLFESGLTNKSDLFTEVTRY
jgi:hypothetical protein